MSQEIEFLQKAWDGYKDKVRVQAQALDVRPNFVCERCKGTTGTTSSQAKTTKTTSSLFSRSFFLPKGLDKPSASDTLRGVSVTQNTTTRRPTQSRTLTNNPFTTATRLSQFVSGTLTQPRDSVVISQTVRFAPPLQHANASTTNPDSSLAKPSCPITFNDKVKKELDVESLHTLSSGEPIFCVNFSQDGERLAAGCRDGKAYVYDVHTGTVMHVLRDLLEEQDLIRALCFSPDGKYLSTGSSNAKIYIWKINTKYVRNAFKGHTRRIRSVDFSPNGRLLVSASYDNTVRLWNMHDGAAKILTEDEPTFLDDPSYSSAVFSPDGRYVAASHRDGLVRIWDVRTGQLIRKAKLHIDRVNAVTFMPDGRGLVTGGWDPALKYWNIGSLYDTQLRARSQTMNGDDTDDLKTLVQAAETWHEQEYLGHKDAVRSLDISPDGRWVASGSVDHSVRIWDTRNATMQCSLNHDDWIYSVDFSPAGCYLASGGLDGIVRIWRYSHITLGGSQVPGGN